MIYILENTVLKDSNAVRTILEKVEKARFFNEDMFIDRNGYTIFKNCLSTGSKTLLNIICHPDTCFDTIECGINAIQMLPLIDDGNVLLRYYLFEIRYHRKCNIMFRSKNFRQTNDFIEELKKYM